MSPLEISRPNALGTDFLVTLKRSGTSITLDGPPLITIGWQEEPQKAYVRIGQRAPLEEISLSPNTPILIGEKTRVGDNVYCVEHPIQLQAIESFT